MIALLVSVVIAGLLFWLLVWFIDWIGLPEPFNKVARVVVGLVAIVYLLGLLTGSIPAIRLPASP